MDLKKELKKYKNMKCFNKYQMEEIRFGLKDKLDVSIYATPEFDANQMLEIRKGLEEGLNVSQYSNPKFDWKQMSEIYNQLLNEKAI